MIKSQEMGGIASLALAMTREAHKSLRETKSRSNLNCAVGRIASLALAMTREKRMGGIASLALAMTREKLFPLRERRRR